MTELHVVPDESVDDIEEKPKPKRRKQRPYKRKPKPVPPDTAVIPDISDEELLVEAGVEQVYSTNDVADFFDRTNQWLYWGLRVRRQAAVLPVSRTARRSSRSVSVTPDLAAPVHAADHQGDRAVGLPARQPQPGGSEEGAQAHPDRRVGRQLEGREETGPAECWNVRSPRPRSMTESPQETPDSRRERTSASITSPTSPMRWVTSRWAARICSTSSTPTATSSWT